MPHPTELTADALRALSEGPLGGEETATHAERSLALVLDVGAALAREGELAPRLEQVTELAAAWIGGFCAVHKLEGGEVRRVAISHEDPAKQALLRDPSLDGYPSLGDPTSPLARALRTGATQFLPEMSDALLTAQVGTEEPRAVLRAVSMTSAIVVPLLVHGRVVGGMAFVGCRRGRRIVASDVKIAEEIARSVACVLVTHGAERAAIEAKTVFATESERAARQHALMKNLSFALTATEVADVVVEHVRSAMGARAGSVALIDESKSALVITRSVGYAQVTLDPFLTIPLDQRVPLTDAARTEKPMFLESVEEYLAQYPHLETAVRSTDTRAFAVLPLVARGRVLGCMGLSFSEARHLDDAERRFLEVAADHCAQALDRAQLYDAERRARTENERLYLESQRAVRMRDDMLAIVSHDLRNPLVAIKLDATQIARATPNERTAHSTARILRGIDRMERMIRDLLDASRIEAGKLGLELERVETNALVREVVDHFSPLAVEKGVEITPRIPDETFFACGDRERLIQVLWNLVGNAMKFTPEGGVVSVGLERARDAVRFEIADSGPGIRPEHLPHVFDRYWRGDGAKNGAGTGLGLFIANGIVAAHGGAIGADSEPGLGARFWFTLPIDGIDGASSAASEQVQESA
jgi:signal transduction histidine kinase